MFLGELIKLNQSKRQVGRKSNNRRKIDRQDCVRKWAKENTYEIFDNKQATLMIRSIATDIKQNLCTRLGFKI